MQDYLVLNHKNPTEWGIVNQLLMIVMMIFNINPLQMQEVPWKLIIKEDSNPPASLIISTPWKRFQSVYNFPSTHIAQDFEFQVW